MVQVFSKENQTRADLAYRFGEFELYPLDRLLKRAGAPIQLPPKAFDALRCLIRRAQHLVSKRELTNELWPSVHVAEANLTNIIGELRKIIGRDAIRTVSKYGYRFALDVSGEPGVKPSTYEKYALAKNLAAERSLEDMYLARDLLWTCLAEEPGFASAWAWLGRCCWFLEKYSASSPGNAELASAVFERAFAIDPELASAHQFYTLVQVDTGRADQAMRRLLDRLQRHPGEPESFASLVQVFRFRGLLKESLNAHRHAAKLDPKIFTSVAPTLFFLGEYSSAIETYKSGRAAYYLDAAAWAALGDERKAKALLRARLKELPLSALVSALMRSLLATLNGQAEEVIRLEETLQPVRDPEIVMFFARHYDRLGLADRASATAWRAFKGGFVPSSETLKVDPWLSSLRRHPEFRRLLSESKKVVREARSQLMLNTIYSEISNI